MKVHMLGTGAPLAPERAGMGLLVTAPDCAPLLIDTCGGFEVYRRLIKTGVDVSMVKNVVVTHRHGDHIGGAMALLIALNEVNFYGLSDTLAGVKDLLQTTYPHITNTLERSANFKPITAGKTLELNGFTLDFFEVQHRVPTVAVRLRRANKVLAFSADSLPCEALVSCAKDADLFVCDALCAAQDDLGRTVSARDLMHPNATEAAQLAVQAGAKKLALTHIVRYASPETMLAEARAIFPGEVSLPNDLDVLEV